ncbi:MAG TPA: hypothetical protein VLH56_11005 [Dissulfurispiraceae bacterium]|nr:hypothetical protein [Dissulfurispiraceae bacterium]
MKYRIGQNVFTPNGPGKVAGRFYDRGKRAERLLVSHDPRQGELPAEVLQVWPGGPTVIWAYDPNLVTILSPTEHPTASTLAWPGSTNRESIPSEHQGKGLPMQAATLPR